MSSTEARGGDSGSRDGDEPPQDDLSALRAALDEARREAEASRRRLAEIEALTGLGSWQWDFSEEPAEWSAQLREMAGLEPGEPVPTYEEFSTYVHPDDRAAFHAALQRSLAEGAPYRSRYRIVPPPGKGPERVVESSAQIVRDEAGDPVRSYGTTLDVTERHRTENQLRIQAELLERLQVAVMASDTGRRLTHWNRAAEEMLGVPRAEALGRTLDEVLGIPPESRRHRAEMVAELGQGGKWEGELTLFRGDGSTFPAFATNAPVRGEGGEIVGYVGAVMDLTETKEAHTELRRRAEEQAAIAALSRAAMSPATPEELIGQAARTVAEMLGVERAEVWELRSDGHALELRASAGAGEPGLAEDRLDSGTQVAETLRTGEQILVEDYAGAPVPPPAGSGARSGATVILEGGEHDYGVLAAYSSARPLRAEQVEFMQAVANVLAAAIARQRAQRLESQIHQNKRLEAVGQLAGGVAHDFNNLLVVILNYADFLLGGIEDEELREDVREIRKAAERAASLTHQLLVFSRREVVVPEAVDLNQAVTETEGLLRRGLREHVELVRSCAPGLWKVRLGSGQAEQILVNLLVNAGEAMPDGGTVEIKTENLELGPGHGKREVLPAGRYVRLTVADTGIGMPDEVAAQAFDPFFTTKKGENGGTGLGLATVYGIVKESGGHVEIYSEPGHGAAFKVYLPAIEDEPGAEPRRAEVAAAGGRTILLVEDEERVRRLAERILTEHGYRVLAAADAEAAQGVAADHAGEIDLLLSDVVLPGLSGPQLAERLRATRPRLRTLLMSGYTGEVVSRHGVVEEGMALVEKPFDAPGLLGAVGTALAGPEPEAGG